ALAADRGRPSYVSELVPQTSTALTLRLVDLLRAEIVRGLRQAPAPPSAARILAVLGTLEQVREAVQPRAAGQLAAHLDSVSFRNPARRPERRGQRHPAPPARAHLQRRARLERPGQRCRRTA